jgi:hypothetical protein
MSNGVVKQGLRQQQKGLSERVSGLEQSVARMLFGINQRFQGTDQRLSALEENSEALIELNGAEDISRIVQEKRVERARAQAEQEKASLDEGVKDGYVNATQAVGEKSIIVVRYTDKDGKVIEPGRAQLVIPGVQPKFKDQLLGKAVGLKMKLDDGGECELLEIYDVDEDKAREVMEAKQKAATEAAMAAAAEAAKADEKKDDGQPAVETAPAEAPPAQQ